MKFDSSQYYKHNKCLDAFIYVHEVLWDDGKIANLIAYWLCQGVFKYWYCPVGAVKIFINENEYSNWEPYTPIKKLDVPTVSTHEAATKTSQLGYFAEDEK